jgi:hypothetical protein
MHVFDTELDNASVVPISKFISELTFLLKLQELKITILEWLLIVQRPCQISCKSYKCFRS